MDVKLTKDFEVFGDKLKSGTVVTCSAKTGRKIIAAGGGKDVAGQIEAPDEPTGDTSVESAEHASAGARRVSTVPGFARTPAPAKKSTKA